MRVKGVEDILGELEHCHDVYGEERVEWRRSKQGGQRGREGDSQVDVGLRWRWEYTSGELPEATAKESRGRAGPVCEEDGVAVSSEDWRIQDKDP